MSPAHAPVCGFVGLGSQGAPIARRMLAAGFPMRLWARRRETLEPFEATLAVLTADLHEVASQVKHLGLCVIDDAAVLEVCEQALPSMVRGARIVIHSTTLPQTCRTIAIMAERFGVAVLEAPVSGGAPAAEAGTLTVMTAGPREVLQAARPMLEAFSGTILHLGGYGAAQSAKLINNTLLAAHMAMADQALAAGVELGIDRAVLAGLLRESSGRSFGLEVLARQTSLAAFPNARSLAEKALLLAQSLEPDSRAASGLVQAVASGFGDVRT